MGDRGARLRSSRWRILGIGASASLHFALILAVIMSPTLKIDLPTTRAIDVRLFAPPVINRPPVDRAPDAARRVARNAASSSKTPAVAARRVEPTKPLESMTETQAGASSPQLSTSGTALRGVVGCDHSALFELSSEERSDCHDRMANGRATLAEHAPLGIDPEKLAVFDAAWTADHSAQHMAGFACLAKFGRGKIQWAHPSEGVKFPLLPCYFYTPKATFSVDAPHKSVW